VHNVSQWPNLRLLGEPLGGAEGLLEAVCFKKATESMGRGRVANARWEWVPDCGKSKITQLSAYCITAHASCIITLTCCIQSVACLFWKFECGLRFKDKAT